MENKDLQNYSWISVEDWSHLPSKTNSAFLYRDDFILFTDILFFEIAFSISGKIENHLLIETIKKRNFGFFKFLDHIYEKKDSFFSDDQSIKQLKKLLKIPNVEEKSIDNLVSKYLALSEEEKTSFLKIIGIKK